MRALATLSLAVLVCLGLPAAGFAQATATPPVPATVAEPPQLFPVEARFAYIDFQRIASDSTTGKLALRILQELRDKKIVDIEGRSKQLQALASKRDAAAVTGPAPVELDKEIGRLQREFQFAQQSARLELQQLETELQEKLHKQVTPVVADIAKEKKLLAVFTTESSLFYVNPAIDISADVIKRLDSAAAKPR
jgi:outer membrane protein